ncbi:MAG: sensor histidine kinase [Marinilabiliaceae bacterium]|nr:sensor histidine kinase [Marinilabiliaceae bacterium]
MIAIKLTRITKNNIAWLLICAGLVIWSVRSVFDIIRIFIPNFGFVSHESYSWGGLVISLCLAVGVYLIKQMFLFVRESEERQRAFEKRLLTSVIDAEENERKRFATELHDGLGPILSSIKMGFSAVSHEVNDPDIRKNLQDSIAEAIVTVREISNILSPHILNNFGLQRAILNFISKLNLPKNITINHKISTGDKRFPATIEIVLYRVLCELINNTLKHAQATYIRFTLAQIGRLLVLTYEDNGIGYTPQEDSSLHRNSRQGSGMGYYNIVSRVTSLKGTVSYSPVNSQDKEHPGLKVIVSLPNRIRIGKSDEYLVS